MANLAYSIDCRLIRASSFIGSVQRLKKINLPVLSQPVLLKKYKHVSFFSHHLFGIAINLGLLALERDAVLSKNSEVRCTSSF